MKQATFHVSRVVNGHYCWVWGNDKPCHVVNWSVTVPE